MNAPLADSEADADAAESAPSQPTIDQAEFLQLAGQGNAARVLLAVERGMPVDGVDENGVSALMAAALNGHSRTVQLLLDNGADPERTDQAGRTALMYASTFNDLPTVRALLEAGSPLNLADQGEGFTALMFAAGEGLAPIVQELLERGADPQLKDVDGDTALDFARRNGHSEVVQLLTNAEQAKAEDTP